MLRRNLPVTRRQSARNATPKKCRRTQERKKEIAMQSKTPISNEASVAAAAPRGNYRVALARSEEEVLEAQRLRYKVFVEELGARVQTRLTGHDIDHYDRFCDHLIVRDEDSGRIVGTYRILSPAAARRVGNYYSENEFDMTRLHPPAQSHGGSRPLLHRQDYRSGAVITCCGPAWPTTCSNGYDYLIGCASIGMADGGHNAANLFQQIGPDTCARRVPHVPPHGLPFERLANGQTATGAPLIKGYLRAGAWICGEPAWDPDFNTADLLLLLPMSRMNKRYMRHFLKSAEPIAA
jgi:putative hemolysin